MFQVIGIGNRLMKDDGIALVVLEYLRDKLEAKGLEVILAGTDYLSCFYQMKDDDIIILIDACYLGGIAGTVHTGKLTEAISVSCNCKAQHDMSLFQLMSLYARQNQGCFIGIEIEEISYGDTLSVSLLSRFPAICNEIECIIEEYIKTISLFITGLEDV